MVKKKLLLITFLMYAPVYSQDINSKLKWKSEIPQVANDPQKWIELIQANKNIAVLMLL